MTTPTNKTIEELKRDIIAELTNGYYEAYKNQSPYLNMKWEEMGTAMRDLATLDLEELITEATQAITQAMLDALPEKMEHRPGLSGVDNGWNACRLEMETAIKKMGVK